MRALFWLLMSGVLWLALVQASPILGIPSQIISLARSGYIAIFSIYMMVELRGARYSSRHRPSHIYLYLLPLVSLLLLSAFSTEFKLTKPLLAVIGCFYLCAFTLVNIRSEAGRIRHAGWDLLAPPLLLILILHPALTAIGGALAVAYLVVLLRRPIGNDDETHLDAFIVQLPSICIAPVVLIALRDVFNGGEMIDRTHVESFGLIVNGVGAAVWTAIVMRGTLSLERVGLMLWLVSCIGAALIAVIPNDIVSTAAAILVAEGFRGAIWLATTVALANLSRGKGFLANFVATILPLAALWIGKDNLSPSATLLLYAAFVLPVPIMAWIVVRRGYALGDKAAGQVDGTDVSSVVLEQKS